MNGHAVADNFKLLTTGSRILLPANSPNIAEQFRHDGQTDMPHQPRPSVANGCSLGREVQATDFRLDGRVRVFDGPEQDHAQDSGPSAKTARLSHPADESRNHPSWEETTRGRIRDAISS